MNFRQPLHLHLEAVENFVVLKVLHAILTLPGQTHPSSLRFYPFLANLGLHLTQSLYTRQCTSYVPRARPRARRCFLPNIRATSQAEQATKDALSPATKPLSSFQY
ncbi:hypothetical protein PsorP6_002327 [Peronosclerospora sorghi]|uniref:Uncharacterized protein n=1 Tax=Peronosclerospora sorghi TaxID=230839 RepID=A0ACC0WSD8_9STRA|nr:hypothetical protein PsorP6_002327 [Peronosclerospora sorghi]